MEKSVHSTQYAAVVALLRDARREAKLTQVELAERLGITQSLLSKYERGELRLDIVQLRAMCQTLDTTLPQFTAKLEARLKKRS